MSEEPRQKPSPPLLEPLLAYSVVLIALIAATLLAALWAPLQSNLLVVAAIFFVAVPYFLLSRRGENFERFGIALERIPARHVLFGLLVSAVIFPAFALGNHFYETELRERTFLFAPDHYKQWPLELENHGEQLTAEDGVRLRKVNNDLHLEFRSPTHAVLLAGDRPFVPLVRGNLRAYPVEAELFSAPEQIRIDFRRAPPEATASTHWLLQPMGSGFHRAQLTPLAQDGPVPVALTVKTHRPGEVSPHQEREVRRTYWWILLWGLTHLLLVALPEEYFYRGYLQTRLNDFFTRDGVPRRFLGFSLANWLTSALFALGHVLIPIGGSFVLARASVFFPSLIFGWMRERTGSIVAPTVFHAAANMMVLLVAVHYF